MVNGPDRPTKEGLTESEQLPDEEQIQAILERRRQAQFSRSPRPTLSPGFDAYTHRPDSRRDYVQTNAGAGPIRQPGENPTADISATPVARKHGLGLSWLMPWRAKSRVSPAPTPAPIPPVPTVSGPTVSGPTTELTPTLPAQPGSATGEWPYPAYPGVEGGSAEALGTRSVDLSRRRRVWDRQPYSAIAYILLTSGILTSAWLLGILIAQVLPGRFEQPPFQESVLRKSSRLTHRLWHFSSLWDTPTTYRRVDAIPLPETGPVSGPIELSPIERQPLVDELNAIETEVVTLERRLASLEKRLGKSPYQGTGIDSRIGTLRGAIDPPVRSEETAEAYEPVASEPNNSLLDVAKLSIVLPADALFSPGDSQLKAAELLEQVLDQLVNYPEATISVRSHSDDQASVTDSQDYTLAQAIALTTYLRRTLPTEHRWVSVGLGQSQPVTDNSDVIHRQRNRRIEILVDTR